MMEARTGVALWERYRPQTWGEVIGQGKALAVLEGFRRRNCLAGRWYWLAAKRGTGKSTIARLLAAELADEWATEELDATRLTPAKLAAIEEQSAARPMGRGHYVFILDEAHGLTASAIRQLEVWRERKAAWVTLIFTTTKVGQEKLFEGAEDANPLLDRCTILPMTDQGLARAAAPRLRAIAQEAGLDGQDEEAYYRLMQRSENSIRKALEAIDAGAMLAPEGGGA